MQVIHDYEDDIVVGDDDIPTHVRNDYFADEVEYSLRSLGLSAEEMRDTFGARQLPTESMAIEAMAGMMGNIEGMRSRLCHESSSDEMFLCQFGDDNGDLGEDLVKTVRNALS